MDLVCVVADSNMEAALSGLLNRPKALGIRPITAEIPVHEQRDPGCFHRPTEILERYRESARHALIILDHAWEGVPAKTGAELESLLEERLAYEGMAGWAVPIVIDPELEAWVFSSSPHVDQVLGWRDRNPALRTALGQQGLWESEEPKPADPKRALEWALRVARKPRNSAIYRELARRVSTTRCQDRAFQRLRGLLQDWFPPSSSGNGSAGRDRPSGTDANGMEYRVKTRKKLIEVALPLDAINAASVREKSIRRGHPSTLHLWWARRPLAAARAVLFAQMVDDPSASLDLFPTEKSQEKERERLFGVIEKLVQWENINDETVLDQARSEIRESWLRTCIENAEHPRAAELYDADRLPAFHDPFAGGGSIPLEAQRLGLEAHASDLNPVAVLINKAMIEIPPRFAGRAPMNPEARTEFERGARWNHRGAQGLAEDVRYYGRWMRDEAEKRIGHLYPKMEVTAEMAEERPDLERYRGRKLTVIAWLWARTVKSPNPAFADVDVPLASTFMLSTKRGKEAYVEPVFERGGYRFVVKVGTPTDPEATKAGTKLGRGANFRCLMSGSPIGGDYIKSEGQAGRMGSRLMTIVAEGERARVYFPPTLAMESIAREAVPDWKPDIEFFQQALGFRIGNYGMSKWSDLFTPRQLVTLTTFSDLVGEAMERVKLDYRDERACRREYESLERAADGTLANPGDDTLLVEGGNGAQAYAEAVALYLGIALSRLTDIGNALCRWEITKTQVRNLFGRQAIPMVWDFAENNVFGQAAGDYLVSLDNMAKSLEHISNAVSGMAAQDDAQTQLLSNEKIVSTDPPYYDNIGYADLSDFFYVWLRRTLKPVCPELFTTVAVPKAEELVATPYRHGGREAAEAFFLDGMTKALHRLAEQSHPGFPVTVYYAFKQTETKGDRGTASTGWETFLDAVIRSGFSVTGTWPIRTELANRVRGMGSNALASSIVLVCRRRPADTPASSRREFLNALRAELPPALAELQTSNIAPVDLAQAAIGPGMAIFSRHSEVMEADGSPMSVRSALVEINRMLDETLARQEGDLDSDTRFCVAWYEQYGTGERGYGEAEVLFNAKNTSFEGLERAGVVLGGKGKVRLKRRGELDTDWDPASDRRSTDWEGAQYLTRSLTAEQGGGVGEAARLVLAMGTERAEKARALAYRLYSLADRKGWAEEARAYNILVTSWPQIQTEVGRLATSPPEQVGFGFAPGEGP